MHKFLSALVLLLSLSVGASPAHAAKVLVNALEQQAAAQGEAIALENCPLRKRWKVAIMQSGTYINFQQLFYFMTKQLMQDQLIRLDRHVYNDFNIYKNPFQFDYGHNYRELARNTKGGCIEFVEDGLFNNLWDSSIAQQQKKQIKAMIAKDQIDMIWAFGTISGIALADSSLGIPVVVINATAPAFSGIVAEGEFSNKPFIHAQKELQRYNSEIVMFHKIFNFKRLGLILDYAEDDRDAQAYPLLKQVAQEKNFELVPCYGNVMNQNMVESNIDFQRCMRFFATADIDAFLLTVGYRPRTGLYPYIKPLLDRQIPIYSQAGESDVRGGALISLSDSDMSQSAFFEVNIIKRILQGEDVTTLSQYYIAPLKLTLNLQTARIIEWKPSFELLVAVDHVIRALEKPAVPPLQRQRH